MAKQAEAQEKGTVSNSVQSLENFDWDDGTGDFFGVSGTAVTEPVKSETKEVVEEETTKTTGKKEEEEETQQDDNNSEVFFSIEDDEEEQAQKQTQLEKGEEEEEESEEDYYKKLTETFKEKGVFSTVEVKEDEQITEERFFELQNEEVEARVEEALEGFMEELDKDAKDFLKFKKEGGNTSEFFATYSQGSTLPKGDISDKAFQEKISRYYYTNVEKLDPEDVEDRIDWLKDGGKLAKYAEKQNLKLIELDKKQKEDLQSQAQAKQREQQEARKAFVSSVKETLDSTDEVDNFKFSPKEKEKLHAFITKPSVSIGKNKYLTGMQDKLQKALSEPGKMLVLAKLLYNDFDVSDVVAATTTEQTKKVKKDIQRAKSTVRPSSSGRTRKERNLADYF